MEDGITEIESGAFASCSELKKIVIPASVTAISSNAIEKTNVLKVYGESGSYAESYASENGITFLPALNELVSDKLTIRDGCITDVKCGKTVSQIIGDLLSIGDIQVFSTDGTVISNAGEVLGTGTVIKFFDSDGILLDSAVISVPGDLDGNGIVNGLDFSAEMNASVGVEGMYSTSGAYRLAADIAGNDNTIDALDAVKLDLMIAGHLNTSE